VPGPDAREKIVFARLIAPGEIALYDQPIPPWRFGSRLSRALRKTLATAGAVITVDSVVTWPGDTLRRFMLDHVLPHELAHHALQHERRLQNRRGARTRDHEARAGVIAARTRVRQT
jgi:hypothetical protein